MSSSLPLQNKSNLYVNIDRNYSGMCGTMVIKNFKESDQTLGAHMRVVEKDMFEKWVKYTGSNLGADYFECGFVEDAKSPDLTALCTKMFDKLSELFPVVFISEKRMNKNSDNMYYFAIFDIKPSPSAVGSKGE